MECVVYKVCMECVCVCIVYSTWYGSPCLGQAPRWQIACHWAKSPMFFWPQCFCFPITEIERGLIFKAFVAPGAWALERNELQNEWVGSGWCGHHVQIKGRTTSVSLGTGASQGNLFIFWIFPRMYRQCPLHRGVTSRLSHWSDLTMSPMYWIIRLTSKLIL